MRVLPDVINQNINKYAGAMDALAKGDEMSEELKPCPFCGNKKPMAMMYADSWMVMCGCSAEGESRETESQAIYEWNTRPLEDALRAQLAALMDCFFEFETIAPNGELMASVLDMHKRLESLEAQLAEAKAKLAWIPVSERLPKFDKSVLFFIPDAETVTQGYRWRTPLSWRWSTEEGALFEQSKVTHWMPLPSAPKEDE